MKRIQTRLLTTTALSALALFATRTPALADCQPDPVADGATVTCTGTDTDGFSSTALNLTVNVNSDALVEGLTAGANSTLTVGGHVDEPSAMDLSLTGGQGSALTIDTTGLITGYHTGVALGDDSTITNKGGIQVTGWANATVTGVFEGNGTIIENSGDISVSNLAYTYRAYGIRTVGSSNTVTNSGTIFASSQGGDAYGMGLTSSDSVTPTSNSGTIIAYSPEGSANGVYFSNAGDFENTGTIVVEGGQGFGVWFGRELSNFTNDGQITAISDDPTKPSIGVRILGDSSNPNTIDNTGVITADNAIFEDTNSTPPSSSGDTITNSGTINGNIVLLIGNDSVSNSNTINGNIMFGSENDVLTNTGTINGEISGGDGSDTLNAGGVINGLVRDFETISGNLTFGSGADVFADAGAVSGNINMGDGNDIFVVRAGTTVSGNVSLGNGDDVVLFPGGVVDYSFISGTFDAGAGNNSVGTLYTAGATITLTDGGDGLPFTLGIYDSSGPVTLDSSSDTVTKTIRIVGNGTFVNQAEINVASGDAISLLSSGMSVTNQGTITATTVLRGSTGTDIIGNDGTINGNVILNAGEDTFQSNGTTTGVVDGGAGNDTFVAYGGSVVDGDILNFENLTLQAGSGSIEIKASALFGSVTNPGVATSTPIVIDTNASFGGIGDLSGNVTNNGVLIPANLAGADDIVGTLQIPGDFTQGANGTLLIGVEGDRSGSLAISGKATLNGKLLVLVLPSDLEILPGATYTILSATGGISGDFSTAQHSSPIFLEPTLEIGTNTLRIVFNRASFVSAFMNSNQNAVARVLDQLAKASSASTEAIHGEAVAFLHALTFSQRTTEATQIDQLIPEAALNLATPALVTRRAFLGAIADNARASGPSAEREGHWWSWASGFGQIANVSGSSGNSSYDFSTGGIVTGASYGLSDTSALGFVLGASTSDINVALQPGNNRHRSVDGALYGAYIDGPASATATASFGYDRFLTDRSINTGLSAVQASGRIGGYTTAGRLEGAYAFDMGAFTLSPYVAAQVMNFHHGTYDETGAGTIGLRIAAENVTSIRSTLGLSAEKDLDLGKFGTVKLHLGAAWEREFGDRILSSKAAFLAAPSQSFEITGITQDKDTANVVGGLTAALTGNVNVSLRYEGNLGATETVNRGRADLTWRW